MNSDMDMVANIEATAHMLYTLTLIDSLPSTKKQKFSKLVSPVPFSNKLDRMVTWLSNQRNTKGGWTSTQEHILQIIKRNIIRNNL